jgi:hypothetical protein
MAQRHAGGTSEGVPCIHAATSVAQEQHAGGSMASARGSLFGPALLASSSGLGVVKSKRCALLAAAEGAMGKLCFCAAVGGCTLAASEEDSWSADP